MPNYFEEQIHPGEFLTSEANGDRSREQVTIAKGQVLSVGAIVAIVLLGGAAASSAAIAGTGNGTIGSLTATTTAKIGAYTATCITAIADGGIFEVKDPDGIVIGNATVGVAFLVNGLGLTIADGSTNFVVGDYFAITVTPITVAAFAGNVGNGTFGTVTVSTGLKPGIHKVVFIEPVTNLGNFYVEDSDGITIGTGKVGTVFTGGGLSFTIQDGGTDFSAGDGFTITVASGSGEYRAYNPTAKDGTETAAGLLYGSVDTTTGSKKKTVIVRDAEYIDAILPWGTLNDNQKATVKRQLTALGLIARTGIGQQLSRDNT